jgi:phage antirepressor YoqD-like protein
MVNMMNDLLIKEIKFNGDNILAVKANNSDKIYVGVKWICDGLGLDVRRQKEKLQGHEVFIKGVSTLPLPTIGGKQDSLVIELDYLPLWLANINPKLVNEVTKPKLIQYQLKAKDVLVKAFLDKFIIPETYSEALKLAADFQSQLEEQRPKVEIYDRIVNSNGLMNFKQVSDTLGLCGRNTLMKILRDAKILSNYGYNKNYPYSKYKQYFQVKIAPRKTNKGLVDIATTLCTTKAYKLIKQVLDKKRDLQIQV